MTYIRYSLTAIKEMVLALPTDHWQIRLVPGDDIPGSVVKSPVYTKYQLLNAVICYHRPMKRGHGHLAGKRV